MSNNTMKNVSYTFVYGRLTVCYSMCILHQKYEYMNILTGINATQLPYIILSLNYIYISLNQLWHTDIPTSESIVFSLYMLLYVRNHHCLAWISSLYVLALLGGFYVMSVFQMP